MHFRQSFLGGMLVLSSLANGQLTRPGNPLPLNFPGLKELKIFEIQVSKEEKMKAYGQQGNSLLKPARSGMLIETDYSLENSGTRDTLTNGTCIWRCAFEVKGARLMSLILKSFQLSRGVRIFIYDPLQQTILGAFSDLNNKATRILATGQIAGEMLIMEVQVPRFAEFPGSLTIAGIGCDFENNTDRESFKDGWYGLSGNCNVDINCMNQIAYQLVKNAVIRIVYLGGERCTGTLMNNTQQDGKNYVLTAEHCIHTENDANTAVFYFSYESPFCNGPDGSNLKSTSGATIRATSDKLDFSLLELLEPVPLQYHPYYAGWDKTVKPPSSAYCIHHPQGDVKKISTESSPLTIASFGDKYDRDKHWLVSHWEAGTTEVGSSGGGLFDADNRIRGSLTGGQANCGNSVNDYFQMFSHDWEDYPSPGNQLAYWLDPLEINANMMDGYDPYAAFWESGDTLSNIAAGEKLISDESGLAWGTWSGHNSLSISQFAEHFSYNQNERMLGVILQVAQNYVMLPSSHIVVKIWQDKEIPGQVLFEKEVSLADLFAKIPCFVEFDSIVSVPDSFFAGYELFYNDPADTFSTFMAGNRLLNPFNTAFIYDNHWQSLEEYTGGRLHSSFGIMPVVFDSIPQPGPHDKFSTDIMIYPNPASEYCWLEFREMLASPVHLAVYNSQGALITEREYGPYQRSVKIETADYRSGIYIIRIKRGNQYSMAKMVIIR